MHKVISLPFALWILWLVTGCGPLGQASDEGDAEQVENQQTMQPQGNSSNAEADDGSAISIGNAIAHKPTSDGCTVDLFQDVTINPKDGNIRAMYSARIQKYAECAGTDKSPVLYLSTQKEFKIDSKYGCKLVNGIYNVRCDGPEVKFTSTGHFQITITGDGQFDPDKIKMRMTYEPRS